MTDAATGWQDLLSQLDESRFLALFRHLSTQQHNADGIQPVAVPHVEMWQQSAGGGSISIGSDWESEWVFQIAHLPTCFAHESLIEDFFTRSLRIGLSAIHSHDDLKRELCQEYWCVRRSAHYYFVTNVDFDWFKKESSQVIIADRWLNVAKELFKEVL